MKYLIDEAIEEIEDLKAEDGLVSEKISRTVKMPLQDREYRGLTPN